MVIEVPNNASKEHCGGELTCRVGGVVDALPALDEGAAALMLHRLRVDHVGPPLSRSEKATDYSVFRFIIRRDTAFETAFEADPNPDAFA